MADMRMGVFPALPMIMVNAPLTMIEAFDLVFQACRDS
jgi:hypothetical protein